MFLYHGHAFFAFSKKNLLSQARKFSNPFHCCVRLNSIPVNNRTCNTNARVDSQRRIQVHRIVELDVFYGLTSVREHSSLVTYTRITLKTKFVWETNFSKIQPWFFRDYQDKIQMLRIGENWHKMYYFPSKQIIDCKLNHKNWRIVLETP